MLPELQEATAPCGTARTRPSSFIADSPAAVRRAIAFSYRDREEELVARVARRLKAERRTTTRLRRPLASHGASSSGVRCPYLYLARDVFGGAGVPFETLDTLPLAAEPYAAALDLALEPSSADFTRSTSLALLRSPHFRFAAGRRSSPAARIAALDFALADARYLGGLDVSKRSRRVEAIDVPASRDERRHQDGRAGGRARRSPRFARSRRSPFSGRSAGQIETLARLAQALRSRAARRRRDGVRAIARARRRARRA